MKIKLRVKRGRKANKWLCGKDDKVLEAFIHFYRTYHKKHIVDINKILVSLELDEILP